MASKLEILVFICLYSLQIAVADPPVFNPGQYTACVTKGAAAGTTVTTITATDTDQGEKVSYAIVGGDGGNLFEIGAASGIITIGTGQTAPSTPPNYTLKCEASSGTAPDKVTVDVTVKVQDSCNGQTSNNGGTGTGPDNQGSNTGTGNQGSNTGTGNQGSNTGTGNQGSNTGTGNQGSNTGTGNQGSNTGTGNQGSDAGQNQNKTNPDSGNSSERACGGIYIWMLGTVITTLISLI